MKISNRELGDKANLFALTTDTTSNMNAFGMLLKERNTYMEGMETYLIFMSNREKRFLK